MARFSKPYQVMLRWKIIAAQKLIDLAYQLEHSSNSRHQHIIDEITQAAHRLERAEYYIREAHYIEDSPYCLDCEGTGFIYSDTGHEKWDCEDCNGTGRNKYQINENKYCQGCRDQKIPCRKIGCEETI